ncbi:MAG TPA: hypothetical protein VHY31_05320 [Streptosporangiaceae bacterium]|nr:hypothetical protein [Streptosporangiaceae bacterium]
MTRPAPPHAGHSLAAKARVTAAGSSASVMYRAYQGQLAGHTTGEIFVRAAEYLKLAATNTPATTHTSIQARH